MLQDKLKAFDQITAELRAILEKKNNDYGDDNIGVLGERGLFVRIWDKVQRLKQLVWNSKELKVKDESIEDTLMDLANYSIIQVILRRGQWK